MAATLKTLLLTAPDSQLDASMVELVKLWNDPPSALQVLEVLDLSIHGGLASKVVILSLEMAFEAALAREGMPIQELVQYATWRYE